MNFLFYQLKVIMYQKLWDSVTVEKILSFEQKNDSRERGRAIVPGREWLGSFCLFTTSEKYSFVRSHLSLPLCVFQLQDFLILLEEFLVIKPSPLCILPLVFYTLPHSEP